jgi:hypothetical protein
LIRHYREKYDYPISSYESSDYDSSGNILSFTGYYPDFEYDNAGYSNQIWEYDEEDNLRRYESVGTYTYCIGEECITIIEESSSIVYEYDAQGRLSEIYDGYMRNTFEYDDYGLRERVASLYNTGSLAYEQVNEYDEYSHLLRTSIYQSDGSLSWRESYRYDYDSSGRQLRLWHYDQQGNLLGGWSRAYDDWGRLRHYRSYDGQGNVIKGESRDYDANSNLRKIQSILAGNILGSFSEYDYDPSGQWLQRSSSYNASGQLSEWHDYRYDQTGRLSQELTYSANGTAEDNYVYNEFGYQVNESDYNLAGERIRYHVVRYDPYGNLLGDYNERYLYVRASGCGRGIPEWPE